MKILLVEDDVTLSPVIEAVLTEQHHTVDVATDGQTGWGLAQAFTYDLILLDVMLPNLDGITLCRRLRANRMTMPILLLTAKNSSDDKVMGFDAGADDYVVKPFDPQELVARVRALLRRGNTTLPVILEWERLRLDPSTCEVTYAGQLLHLTPKEYSLLELFLRNRNRVFSRSAILEQLWSFEEPPSEETVRAHIKGLRQKLKAAGVPTDIIETVYGLGYRLKPPAVPTESHLSPAPSQDSPASVEVSENPQATRSLHPVTETSAIRSQQVLSGLSKLDSAQTDLSLSPQAQTRLALNRLWERFKEPIKERVTVIEQAIGAIDQGQLSEELRNEARHAAHKLVGSLGTYGFTEGSRLARQLENFFCARPDSDQVPVLSDLVVALRNEIDPKPVIVLNPQKPGIQSSTSLTQPSVVLALQENPSLTEALLTGIQALGMRGQVAADWQVLRYLVFSNPPDVILLDLSDPDTAEEGLHLLSELTTQAPSMPVLVITGSDGFADRLEVARRGGRAFLQKPILPTQVIELILDVLQRFQTHQSKVMIVDDDVTVLGVIQELLKPWGFKLMCLEDPRQFWDTLEVYVPDLLILDVEMPQLSGIELCQVVRNEPRWSGLPVLFLTAHTDIQTVHQVFASGADDYVSKPVVGPELVTRILNRLERTQLLRSRAETDPLTGLLNRRKSIQDLGQLMRLAERYQQPLCFGVIDLDHFKRVNDQHGHLSGDAVLRRFGELLLRMFRSEDVVARWGGEEFVVGMYGMTTQDGVKRLEEFLVFWRQQTFSDSQGVQFRVTFSAGVSEYPTQGSDLQSLYRHADAALYQAKAAGRNRVLPAHFAPSRQSLN
jgi:diguanylate cyclase (GGDEF)-like protein